MLFCFTKLWIRIRLKGCYQYIGEIVMYKRYIKRFIDFILAFFMILLLLIPMLLIAILIKCETRGPILFVQTRVGLHKQNFKLLKFRSMRVDAPAAMPTRKLSNKNIWITRSGSFLRKTGLDELPQLFNILLGQMSFIGPRPVIPLEQDVISERDKYGANDVLPGLSGWAQINGRDDLEESIKAKYDGDYVQNVSLLFDIKCVIGTVLYIFKHENIFGAEPIKEDIPEKETSQTKL